MVMNDVFELACIGNYTKDTIITPSGTNFTDGGAINYSAHAANLMGVKTIVVTRLAKEDYRVIEKFEKEGIAYRVTYTPSSTLMELYYPTIDPDIRTLSVEATAGTITAEDVDGLKVKSAVIGPSLRGEVGLDVIKALKGYGATVAADMQGYIRVLRDKELKYEPWGGMKETLQWVDVVKSDMVEAEFLTGETDIRSAAKVYASMGPKEIVLTHRDGMMVFAGGEFFEFGFYPKELVGRSGRGDTCIGSYMAARLTNPPQQAGRWSAAVTSLKMENLGPFHRSMADVEELIHSKYNHGAF
jgi:sugar/nucleoside kinase (ribokinase family)